jgi:hypothetical protein
MDDFEKEVHQAQVICIAAECTKGLAKTVDVNEQFAEVKKELQSLHNLLWGLLVTFAMLSTTAAGVMIFAWVSKGGKG